MIDDGHDLKMMIKNMKANFQLYVNSKNFLCSCRAARREKGL